MDWMYEMLDWMYEMKHKYTEINEINVLLITYHFFLVCPPGVGKLVPFSRVNGDAVDLNQKCYGVQIHSGAERVIFCVFMCRKFRENKTKSCHFRIFAYDYGIICILT